MPRTNNPWMRKYLAPLVGSKIVGIGVSKDGFPQIKVDSMENGFTGTIEISRDEEGNGPGFIFGLPEVSSASSSDPEPAVDPRPWGDPNVELFPEKKPANEKNKMNKEQYKTMLGQQVDSLRKESVRANELLKQIVDEINADDLDGFINIGSLLDAVDNYCASARSKWLEWAVKNEQLNGRKQ